MEMNLASMSYLFFRLAPFILVCFFALGSILNSELKGFVYLVGLCFTCFVTFMLNVGLWTGFCPSKWLFGKLGFKKTKL